VDPGSKTRKKNPPDPDPGDKKQPDPQQLAPYGSGSATLEYKQKKRTQEDFQAKIFILKQK
jgi:hypothetical protein